MPSSLRRREGRLVRGANKKIRIHSAEFSVTVGVIRYGCNQSIKSRTLKASEGAERSSSRRTRGSRGLRKGKARARGRQPRRSVIRQPLPTLRSGGPKSRVLRSHLRMCDFHARIRDKFRKLIRSLYDSDRFVPPVYDPHRRSFDDGVNWKKTKERWERLHSHLVRTSSKFLADVALSHRFNPFIEDVVGIDLTRPQTLGGSNHDSFSSLLSGLRESLPVRDPETQPGSSSVHSTGLYCVGRYCRVCGRRSFRGAPCPGKPVPIPRDLLRRGKAAQERRYPRPKRGH